MKLLVIEDDRETAAYLIKGLSESGYTIDHSDDGRDGLFLATSGSYDAIILDRMLPGMDGLALLGALRGAEIRTPALILSALGSVDDRVKGLRSGGDDYLVKPFAFSELLARIEALLRRGADTPSITRLRVADLELDLLTRSVRRGDKTIDLLPREFQLLEYLMRNAGHVVTRTMLLGERVGLSLRPADQCDRRACQPVAPENRQELRPSPASHRARRRVLPARTGVSGSCGSNPECSEQ